MATAAKPFVWGTGRRKTAVARVRIRDGTGTFIVNDLEVDKYFELETQRNNVRAPLAATDMFPPTRNASPPNMRISVTSAVPAITSRMRLARSSS